MPACRKIEALLLSEPDGALSAAELTVVEADVAGCESCRRQRILLSEVSAALKNSHRARSVPSASEEWMTLHERIHNERRHSKENRRAARPWLRWGIPALSLGTAAAVACILYLRAPAPTHFPRATIARAEYVQSENAESTLVYVDQESGWLIVWASSPGNEGTAL